MNTFPTFMRDPSSSNTQELQCWGCHYPSMGFSSFLGRTDFSKVSCATMTPTIHFSHSTGRDGLCCSPTLTCTAMPCGWVAARSTEPS